MNPEEQKTAAPTAAPAPANAAPNSRKKLSKNVIIGIIVGAIVLAGVIAWAVYATIANSPENLIKAAAQNLAKDKQAAGTMKIENGTESASTSVMGDFAFATDPANDKNGQLVVGVGEGDKRFTFQALALDKTTYLKVANAENIAPLFGVAEPPVSGDSYARLSFAAMLKNINNQWFELTEQDVKSLASSTGGTAGAPLSGSPEDLKRLMEIYDRHTFVKADQVFADEVVDGANSAHFSIRLDRDQYVKFVQAVKDANLATVKVSDKDIEEAKKAEERPQDARIELWIARDSKKFKQLRAVNTKKGEESTVTLTFTGKLPTLEKYEKPAGAKPISELMTMLIGPSINPVELDALQSSQSSELYMTQ